MAELIDFVRNHQDLSTERGFQFEFNCDRCGAGVRTEFVASTTGLVAGVLDAASGLFGGILGSAADVGRRVHSAAWERAHDTEFRAAAAQAKPSFIQCPHCSAWVCRAKCWNERKGLCKECAPDLGVAMAAAQAAKSVEEIHAHACMADEDKKLGADQWRAGVRASCPQCEAPLATNAKFCAACGAKLQVAAHCTQCGAKLTSHAKFCPECGARAGA